MYHSNEPDNGHLKPYDPNGGSFEEGWESDPAYRLPEEEDVSRKRTIFKPRLTKPNFVLSVLVNAVRLTVLLIVLCGLALAGAVVWIVFGTCPECGKFIGRTGARFCPHCGEKLE